MKADLLHKQYKGRVISLPYKPTKKDLAEAKKDQALLDHNQDYQKVLASFFGKR
jgi:hypothetical protein